VFNFGDEFFKKIEKKTNINKDTILNLANKLQKENLKDEQTLRNLIKEISDLTGKQVSKDKEDKIIEAVLNDKVSDELNKMVD
jgi:TPP-dependent pyruvate/acetoin dehydrogenase alpha subunit